MSEAKTLGEIRHEQKINRQLINARTMLLKFLENNPIGGEEGQRILSVFASRVITLHVESITGLLNDKKAPVQVKEIAIVDLTSLAVIIDSITSDLKRLAAQDKASVN